MHPTRLREIANEIEAAAYMQEGQHWRVTLAALADELRNGAGQQEIEDVAQVIEAIDRRIADGCGKTVPAPAPSAPWPSCCGAPMALQVGGGAFRCNALRADRERQEREREQARQPVLCECGARMVRHGSVTDLEGSNAGRTVEVLVCHACQKRQEGETRAFSNWLCRCGREERGTASTCPGLRPQHPAVQRGPSAAHARAGAASVAGARGEAVRAL